MDVGKKKKTTHIVFPWEAQVLLDLFFLFVFFLSLFFSFILSNGPDIFLLYFFSHVLKHTSNN